MPQNTEGKRFLQPQKALTLQQQRRKSGSLSEAWGIQPGVARWSTEWTGNSANCHCRLKYVSPSEKLYFVTRTCWHSKTQHIRNAALTAQTGRKICMKAKCSKWKFRLIIHTWADRQIMCHSQLLPSLFSQRIHVCISWSIYFFVAKFLCSPAVIPLRIVLKTITHFTISHLCLSMIYFCCKRFCQKNFIMCYRMSLWFGIIKCSLCVYRPQIPADHKERL